MPTKMPLAYNILGWGIVAVVVLGSIALGTVIMDGVFALPGGLGVWVGAAIFIAVVWYGGSRVRHKHKHD